MRQTQSRLRNFIKTKKDKVKSKRSMRLTVATGIMAVLCGLVLPAQQAYAAVCETSPFSLDWASIPWDETDIVTTEVDTYFDTSIHADNPYHGLASATGGVSTFFSQTFTDVDGNGTDLTIYYSPNMDETGNPVSTPEWYGPTYTSGINPDERVTATTAARMPSDRNENFNHPDHGNVATPASYVFSFSQPVLFQEMISGSLSEVTDFENSTVRAFDDPLAEGNVVKATKYNNISDISDDSTLIQQFGNPAGPITNNSLANVLMDPDYTYDAGGVAQDVGLASDDGIYHTIGGGLQADDSYGRVLLAWEEDPLQSLAVSTFVTGSTSHDDDDYLGSPASTIAAPFTFCVAAAATDPPVDPTDPADPSTPDDEEELAPTGQNVGGYIMLASLLIIASLGVMFRRKIVRI